LTAALHGEDESLRGWAIRGLKALDTKEARRRLWEWDQNQFRHVSQVIAEPTGITGIESE
jgi:hypothetical protein